MTFRLLAATLAAALAVGALTSCVSPYDGMAERGQTELIGISKAALLACAGEPSDTARENGAELFIYFREVTRRASGIEPEARTPIPQFEKGSDYSRYCEAVFFIRQDRVTAIEMKGRTSVGRATLTACGPIVERCLKVAGRT